MKKLIRNSAIVFSGTLASLCAAQSTAVITVNPGTMSTLTGQGSSGSSGDGGLATAAKIGTPYGMRLDSAGNIYIADSNSVIREISASTGIITTVAGTGTAGSGADGIPATTSALNTPRGVFVDGNGNIYISDSSNNRIQVVYKSGTALATLIALEKPGTVAVAGDVYTLAGTGSATGGYGGDNVLATSTTINSPRGIFVDTSGNLFIADANNNRVRKVSITTGLISTVAGNGTGTSSGDGGAATSAGINTPLDVYVEASGNFLVAEFAGAKIRKVASGVISTVAGNGTSGKTGDGSIATSAELNGPRGVWEDAAGQIYIADYNNNRIQKVDGNGIMNTLIGNGTAGYTGNGVAATSAEINLPYQVATDVSGNVYVASSGDARIQKDLVTTNQLTYTNVQAGSTSTAQTLTIVDAGAAPLDFSAINIPTGFMQVPSGSTDCTASSTVAPGMNCEIALEFAPTTTGTYNTSALLTTNAANSSSAVTTIALTGSSFLTPTIRLRTSASTIDVGNTVTLTADLAGTSSAPTGTITFKSGTTVLGTANLQFTGSDATSTAILNLSNLAAGTYTVVASYGGDSTYQATASSASSITVYSGPGSFSLTTNASSLAVNAGNFATYTLSLASLNGFNQAVALQCSGLPANAGCNFSANPVTLAPGQTSSVTLYVTTGIQQGMGRSPEESEHGKISFAFSLAAVLLCFGFPGRYRSKRIYLCLMAALVLATSTIGCNASLPADNISTAASGSYAITVTGTAGNGANAVSQTLNLMLTVN